MARADRSQLKSWTRARPRSHQGGPQLGVAQDALEGPRDVLRAVRVHEDGRVAHDLGQRRDARGDDRGAAGHGLERRQAEALVEGGEREDRGQTVERGQRVVGDEAEEPHVLAHARRLHAAPQRAVAVDLVADDQELHVLVPAALLEQAEGRDQPLEVLVRLDVPRVEHEAPADLVPLAHALHLFLAGVLEDGFVDGVGHDLEPVGVGLGIEAQDVPARGLGHGEDQLAAVHRVPHHEPGVALGHAVRQVLREEQVDAVVDGDHRGLGAHERQHVVRRVVEVGAELAQLARDGEVLAHAVARGPLHHGHEVLRQVAERALVRFVAEEEVGGLAVEEGEVADDVADVGADPVVPPLPRVDRDLHQEAREPRATGGGAASRMKVRLRRYRVEPQAQAGGSLQVLIPP